MYNYVVYYAGTGSYYIEWWCGLSNDNNLWVISLSIEIPYTSVNTWQYGLEGNDGLRLANPEKCKNENS